LIEQIPEHEDKDPADLAKRCKEALRRLISRIYEAGRYPSSRHGHEEERYEVLARFVEQDETLPIDLSGEDSSEENPPEENPSKENLSEEG
jgi:hypothetical protein